MSLGAIDARIVAFFKTRPEVLLHSVLRHAERRLDVHSKVWKLRPRDESDSSPDLSHPRGRDDALVLLALRIDEQDAMASPFRTVVDQLFELYPGEVAGLCFREWKARYKPSQTSLEGLGEARTASGIDSLTAFLALLWISLHCRFGPSYRGPKYDLPNDLTAATWLDALEGAIPSEMSVENHRPSPLKKNDELLEWLRSVDGLKGKGRLVLEAVVDAGGELPLNDLAAIDGIDWSPPLDNAYNKQQSRINAALEEAGLKHRLERRDNAARLFELPAKQ